MAKKKAKVKVKPDRRTKAELVRELDVLRAAVSTWQSEIYQLQDERDTAHGVLERRSRELAESEAQRNALVNERNAAQMKSFQTMAAAQTLFSFFAGSSNPNALKERLRRTLDEETFGSENLDDYKPLIREMLEGGYAQALRRDPVWPNGASKPSGKSGADGVNNPDRGSKPDERLHENVRTFAERIMGPECKVDVLNYP